MLRFILSIMMPLVCLLVTQVMLMTDSLGHGFNVLESNKEIAYQIECSLETVQERVGYVFEKGGLSQEKWKEFKQLHWEAESFHHLFVMANLFYEEAPVETYGRLVELFARDMVQRLVLLDRFCMEIGIEAIPFETI
ncbi:MAG TPA: hypothetical protein ACFYED_08290 [Candidatus Tripitaka californicus]|uniref:hypothetical protein n=1 Tax=Candidatus Tripitaka californicus TaxID=3367616 RepID=UPI004029B0DC|nr:hypothetical protein [Planctomycetota bacterium]